MIYIRTNIDELLKNRIISLSDTDEDTKYYDISDCYVLMYLDDAGNDEVVDQLLRYDDGSVMIISRHGVECAGEHSHVGRFEVRILKEFYAEDLV